MINLCSLIDSLLHTIIRRRQSKTTTSNVWHHLNFRGQFTTKANNLPSASMSHLALSNCQFPSTMKEIFLRCTKLVSNRAGKNNKITAQCALCLTQSSPRNTEQSKKYAAFDWAAGLPLHACLKCFGLNRESSGSCRLQWSLGKCIGEGTHDECVGYTHDTTHACTLTVWFMSVCLACDTYRLRFAHINLRTANSFLKESISTPSDARAGTA